VQNETRRKMQFLDYNQSMKHQQCIWRKKEERKAPIHCQHETTHKKFLLSFIAKFTETTSEMMKLIEILK